MLKKGKITVDVDENQMSWTSARPNSRQQPPTLQWAELSPPPHTRTWTIGFKRAMEGIFSNYVYD